MFALTPIVVVYHSLLALLTERRSLLFCIYVNDHCTYALMSFFLSVLPVGPKDSTLDSEGVTFLAESGFLLPLPSGVRSFVSEVRLFAVLQLNQFDYKQAYLAYHQSLEVDWDDAARVGWLPCTKVSFEVLDNSARDVPSAKRNVEDAQVKLFVRSVPVKFKAGPRKTLEEAHTEVNSAYGCSSGFPGLSVNVHIVDDEIVEEDAPRDLHSLTTKNDRGPSVL